MHTKYRHLLVRMCGWFQWNTMRAQYVTIFFLIFISFSSILASLNLKKMKFPDSNSVTNFGFENNPCVIKSKKEFVKHSDFPMLPFFHVFVWFGEIILSLKAKFSTKKDSRFLNVWCLFQIWMNVRVVHVFLVTVLTWLMIIVAYVRRAGQARTVIRVTAILSALSKLFQYKIGSSGISSEKITTNI